MRNVPKNLKSIPKKVNNIIEGKGLPTSGKNKFDPKIVSNRKGQQVIATKEVDCGPKGIKKGFVDKEGNVWVKDTAHGNVPEHWDVQMPDGSYDRVGLDGKFLGSGGFK